MFSLPNFYQNVQKVFKCTSEGLLFKYRPNYRQPYEVKSVYLYKCGQIRFTNSFTPPPGSTPVEHRSIPYVRPEFEPSGGGGLLLLIPLITFGLGTWQVKRLKWKTELIKSMEERAAMDPVPLPLDPEEVAQMEFRKVTVKGTFDHEHEILYGPKPCLINGEPNEKVIHPSGKESYGYNLVTPLVVSGSGERVLVNRGWIRTKEVNAKKRPWSTTEGEQTITGVVRSSEPVSSFVSAVDPRYNIWHFRDIVDIANKNDCLPIFIDATTDHSIPDKLWAGQTRRNIRNEHLTYIITWYALSLCTAYMWYMKYKKRRL